MEQILGQFKIIEKQSDEDADDSPTKKIYDHHQFLQKCQEDFAKALESTLQNQKEERPKEQHLVR